MKRHLATLVATLFLAAPAWAGMDHGNHGAAMTAMNHAAKSEALSDGLVKKVDKAQGKLTVRHGPLENLDMPAMTMVFRVKDPAMLDRVKSGDNIRFHAEQVNGLLTITRIEAGQ